MRRRPISFEMRASFRVLAALLAASSLLLFAAAARAEGEGIAALSSKVTSEFPEGIRFELNASGENEIESIAVRFKTGTQPRMSYDYMELEKGREVDAELFWRTNTAARYIPPGTIITYSFEIEDSAGSRLDTEPEEFIYRDIRFEWEDLEDGPVSVAFHGPVRTRAEIILDALVETLSVMGPLLGADTTEPIRVTMYNNRLEMIEALPPGSTTIRRELITEGQAFTNIGTLLVLGSGRLARGTASHEMTHILTHRAGDSSFRSVPAWLDEGLSEFGNVDPGFSYTVAVEFAIATDRLLPITSMPALPGDPEDVIIFYGQARSIVRFMVGAYGAENMESLMGQLKSGTSMDEALQDIYRVNRLGLENQWRRAIDAPLLSVTERRRARPTPIPRRTFTAYNLSELMSGAAGTPTPEPTSAPEPTATAAASAEDSPTAGPPPDASGAPAAEPSAQGGGGPCSAPVRGGARGLDTSVFVLALGLAGLGFRRWFSL